MKNTLSENRLLINQDAQKILDVRFSMLFSINRNRFFSFLRNYVGFYSEYRSLLLIDNSSISTNAIPELMYKDYTLSLRFQILLILVFPISFWIFIQQWNYIVKLKRELREGLKVINSLVKNPINKNTNYTAPKTKRK
ncbi:hypothetical protein [uncultured Cytophaga sp.]|mgnify:CR=1 FL=1|uniref:hypothetical protein n=1 Tax=uncultured Cytophaga sp. TaxID=160238 RepID=UPI00260F0B2F|nr:hypothetical protein [uncultured Cytophaga sp.]